jgi:hypothetical protein
MDSLFGFGVTAPQWAMASSFTRFLDHINNDAPQSGLLWTSNQLVTEISAWQHTQHSQQTNVHTPGGIRTHYLSRRVATDLRLTTRSHWDRQLWMVPRSIHPVVDATAQYTSSCEWYRAVYIQLWMVPRSIHTVVDGTAQYTSNYRLSADQ